MGLSGNVYMRLKQCRIKDGTVKVHPIKSTHWVADVSENCTVFYGRSPPK